MEFHFMRPQWLLLIVPALLMATALWYQRDRAGSWQSVIAPHLLEYLVGEQTTQRVFNALPFIVVAWILAAFTASGPSWEKLPQPVHQKQDALVVLLDLSYSMKSEDLAPSRKDRARQKLLDLMATRKEGQTGLIAYAGDAHIVTPLTDDTQTIANLLPALNPGMMPVPGSNPAGAVAQGLDLLRSAGVATGRLLLVTDELTDKDTREITKLLRRESTPLSIMSVGTATGAPIPLPRGGFLKDSQGDIVMPGVNPAPLRALASETGGRYMAMQIDDSDIEFLLAESPLLMDEQTIALDRTADAWEDQGYLFLIPLLPLVLALFRRGWLLQIAPVFLLISFIAPVPEAMAQQAADPQSKAIEQPSAWDNLWQTPDQQGRAALAAGEAERAAQLFETPQWSGTAAYQHQDYETATEAFAEDASADGWYNRGNSLARAGELDEAIAAYQESLKLAPGKEDAEQNLALVEKLKEQQEQEQEQQQEQDGDEQQEQDQQENDQESEQNSESEQDPGDEQSQQNEQSESGDQQASNDAPPQAPEEESEDEREQHAQQQQAEEEQAQEQNQQPAQMPPVNPEELERDQAMEQWLRRVPDDPSGLLREKFRYESQLRQQQGTTADNEKNW